MRVRPGNRVLDIGCGCGILTVMAAALAGSSGLAHGIDMNLGVCCVEFTGLVYLGGAIFWISHHFSGISNPPQTYSGIGDQNEYWGEVSTKWREFNPPPPFKYTGPLAPCP